MKTNNIYYVLITWLSLPEEHNWRITILLGIILGGIVYGSVKFVQMGGINP